MQVAAKAEAKLDNTCEKYGISKDGRKWLGYAIDPFKDTEQPRPTGFPDQITIPSVVQEVHQRLTVAAPASAAGGNWDANIFFDGMALSEPVYSTTYSAGQPVFTGQGATAYSRGGVQVRSAAAGTSLDITTSTSHLDLDGTPWQNGRCRVLALGMEIHNESPPTVKSGSVACWRNPVPTIKKPTGILGDTTGAAAWVPQIVSTAVLADPPYTASLAVDLQGSTTWEAEAGAYIVSVLKEPENPPSEMSAVAIQGYDDNLTTYYAPQIVKTGTFLLTMPTANIANSVIPFSQSGAYFTDLNNATSLIVDLVWYVEIFPTITSILRRSAVPSCNFDGKAMELYNLVMSKIPAGVPVDENFLGAFIAGAARIAQAVIPTVMRVASGAARVANGISGAVEVVSRISDAVNTANGSNNAIVEYVAQNQPKQQQLALIEPVRQARVEQVLKPQRSVVVQQQPVRFVARKKRNPNKAAQQKLANSIIKQHTANRWVDTQPEMTIRSKRLM